MQRVAGSCRLGVGSVQRPHRTVSEGPSTCGSRDVATAVLPRLLLFLLPVMIVVYRWCSWLPELLHAGSGRACQAVSPRTFVHVVSVTAFLCCRLAVLSRSLLLLWCVWRGRGGIICLGVVLLGMLTGRSAWRMCQLHRCALLPSASRNARRDCAGRHQPNLSLKHRLGCRSKSSLKPAVLQGHPSPKQLRSFATGTSIAN